MIENELKSIINTVKKTYPKDEEIWVELFDDVPMGIAEKATGDNTKDAYLLLQFIVKDWNFADAEGKKIPINADGVRSIPSKISEWLVEEAMEIIKPDEVKKKE